jgi:hypothetical protein
MRAHSLAILGPACPPRMPSAPTRPKRKLRGHRPPQTGGLGRAVIPFSAM